MSKRHPSIEPVHPSEILREDAFPALGVTKPILANALGVSRQTLHDIMTLKRGMTPDMAVRLEAVVGSTAETWLALQAAHDLWKARKGVRVKSLKKSNCSGDLICQAAGRSSHDVGLALEPGGQGIEVDLLQIVSPAGSGRKAEVGVLRTALILGDDVLVQRTLLYTVKPIGQGVIRRAPTDQHVVPVTICGIAVTDRELVADTAGCQGSASLEEVRVIAGHVPDVGVLPGVEGNAEAVLDPHCAVVAASPTNRVRPAWIILQHKRQTVGAVGIVTKIDVEGGLEVVGKIDALVEHRRARFAGRVRRQHEGVVRAVVGGRAVDDAHYSIMQSDFERWRGRC